MGVSIQPGAMALTVMPNSANSAVSVWITVLAGAVGYGILLVVSGTLGADEIMGMIGGAPSKKILFWKKIGRKA